MSNFMANSLAAKVWTITDNTKSGVDQVSDKNFSFLALSKSRKDAVG